MKQQPISSTPEQGWLSLVGLSEAGWAELSEAARRAVQQAELLVGGQRHLDHIPDVTGQKRLVWPSPLSAGIEQLQSWQGRPVCVLASGDPFWYGIGATLSRYFPPRAMISYPGPSAFSLAAARLGWPLQQVHCHSLVARDPDRLRAELAPGRKLLVLSNDETSPARVARILRESGYGASRLVVLEALGGPDEHIRDLRAADGLEETPGRLNTLAVECRCDDDHRPHGRVPGRANTAFEQDGQISQPEIRAVVMAHLAPRGGEHLWDLGSGSGAVAVEWLRADTANQATAVEQHPDRAEHIEANARLHGVGHLTIRNERIEQARDQLDAPDAILIGGGLTSEGLVEHCWHALPPSGRCVATAVTAESEAILLKAHALYGGQLIRLSIDRTEPLGRFTGWKADRPITLWSATKRPPQQETHA